MKPRFMHLLVPLLTLIAVLQPADMSAAADKKANVEVNFIYAFQLGFGSYNVGGLDV